MKLLVALSTLLAVSLAEDAKVVAAPLPYYAGYPNLNSAKAEAGNTYGGVNGGYSYVDANGVLQQVQYVADAAGFRVADSRLPVAPVYDGVAPVAPVDTAEVAEAKAAFAEAYAAQEAAVAAVAERKKREADP